MLRSHDSGGLANDLSRFRERVRRSLLVAQCGRLIHDAVQRIELLRTLLAEHCFQRQLKSVDVHFRNVHSQ
jgi:hypothetical protein